MVAMHGRVADYLDEQVRRVAQMNNGVETGQEKMGRCSQIREQ